MSDKSESIDMARAETVETVEGGTGRSDPFPSPQNNYLGCHGPPNVLPSLLNTPHHLDTCHTIYVLFRLPHPYPGGHGEPQQSPRAPTPPLSPLSEGGAPPRDLSGEESDLDGEDDRSIASRRGPLPDLLPHSRHPRDAAQETECRRVAEHLKMIGDSFNDTALRRAHFAQQWQDWEEVCRGLLNFITQTISTLYRLT
ncbi:bcl-2-binding component 3 isoform X2 [Oryzias latipes]